MAAVAQLVAASVEAYVPSPSLNALVHDADVVVVARIGRDQSVTETYEVNPEGTPAKLVVTYYTLTPVEFLKGSATEPLTLRVLGGRVDGNTYAAVHTPRLLDGETAVLFLQRSSARRQTTGTEVFFLPHWHFGRFALRDRQGQAAVYRRSGLVGLGLPEEDIGGDGTIPYSAFRSHILHQLSIGRSSCQGSSSQ